MNPSSAGEPVNYITFKLGDESFALNVLQVREVLDLAQITRVPTAPDYMRGVVNVRGNAIPVVDLRTKFGLPVVADTLYSRIVVMELELDGELAVVGGIADSVHNVIELDPSLIKEPPRLGARWRADFIAGMGTHEGDFVTILDIGKIFASDVAVELGLGGPAEEESSMALSA